MLFKRKLPLNQVREALRKKLIDDGLTPINAKKTANMMSKGDIFQLHKDLQRHPKLVVVNKKTGNAREYTGSDFDTPDNARELLRKLARENKVLYSYLSQYFHQGGFMNLAELLMSYYFLPNTVVETSNRRGVLTIEKDGSVSYEEKFDIISVKDLTSRETFKLPHDQPIATISLKSNMKEEKHRVSHRCAEIKVKAHDKVAEKYFEDPRGKFSKFLSWIKDSIHMFFSRFEREQEHKRQAIQQPRKKL
ncbi:MAG: DUF762 family protein [Proteobacteria bacterium]|nr:DUF762 family protein [Pseudomonadota bacterium]